MDFSLVGGSHPLSSCPFVAQSVWRYLQKIIQRSSQQKAFLLRSNI